jgi:signal transduction histidine kinase
MVRQAPLWRAIAVFRVVTLAHAALLVILNAGRYAHPAGGWLVLAAMVAWTGLTLAYERPRWRSWPVLAADLAVAVAVLLTGAWVVGTWVGGEHPAPLTLPSLWVAAPVLAWAVRGGWPAGVAAALVVAAADLAARGGWRQVAGAGPAGVAGGVPPGTVNAAVLLLLAGFIVGYFARLARDAEHRLQQAARQEAAIQERERLARGIHDSVLQVLALVQRRGTELGGEAAVLGRLAGEQEATLRALVAGALAAGPGAVPVPAGTRSGTGPGSIGGPSSRVDLRALLERHLDGRVTLSAPAEPVLLAEPAATDLAAAVASALDNVHAHAGPGASAWVLVEAEPDAVTVTIRDDGAGMPPGRLAWAAAEGRLGVSQSIQGRMRDLGGTASIVSAPGEGTEVELRLPCPGG